jgi:hypothetical protein
MYLRDKSNFVFLFSFLCILFVLSSCRAKIALINIEGEYKVNKNYDLGKPLKATVGNPLIRVENLFVRPSFSPIFEYEPPSWGPFSSRPEKLKPKQIWEAIARIPNEAGYVLQNPSFTLKIHINLEGTIGRGWIYSDGSEVIQSKWTTDILFKRNIDLVEKGSFAAELIYTGITGKTVRITYREFIDDMARPAFFQDLTYELTESNIIMFRSIRIKVLETTNSYIRFIVEDDAGLPWIPIR